MRALISMSGIVGKSQDEVLGVLNSYFNKNSKVLKETALNTEIYKLFLLSESNNNSVILYPELFSEINEVAIYLGKKLDSPIFNFYIYDVDLWMYELFYDGKIIDRFCPLPRYIEDIGIEEIKLYKGNPKVVCKFLEAIQFDEIREYYKPWTEKLIKSQEKAYSNDEFTYGMNWQAVDFMRKLGLKYPIVDEEELIGRAFKLI
ncbi:hypothetical protein GKZ28_20620 [Clostridium chromiireducens]|uniref:Uncharacterized protein n=1 Tax=Clostridium chromiireducens TaxID=225345 RepID=A0A964RQV9_9CLOT|nr:hypothetical protein [Clostridium chromiireducens]MVX66087.1 hypothetical protein [Clostridium chromiireducens]